MSQSFWLYWDSNQEFQVCPYVLSLLVHLMLCIILTVQILFFGYSIFLSGIRLLFLKILLPLFSVFSFQSKGSCPFLLWTVCLLCLCMSCLLCFFFPSLLLKISLPSPSQLAGSHMTAVDSYGWPKPTPVYFLIWAHILDCLGVSFMSPHTLELPKKISVSLRFSFHSDIDQHCASKEKIAGPSCHTDFPLLSLLCRLSLRHSL